MPAQLTWSPAGESTDPSVVCIGVFDGVHRGHRHLIEQARLAAQDRSLPLTAITFDPHPMSVVRPDAAPLVLATLEHRVQLLRGAGADRVAILGFDAAVSLLSPKQFVLDVLLEQARARHVVVGADFRFGHRAAGDVADLAGMGEQFGFTVGPVDLMADGEGSQAVIWSSTVIREMVAACDVEGAAAGLARHHRVEGTVAVGDRRGRRLGFPTANLHPGRTTAVPGEGVYAGWLVRDPNGSPQPLPAAISVGQNPTFSDQDHRVEAFAIGQGRALDLYGEHVAVEFVSRLRGMEAFGSVDDLIAAMHRDVARATVILSADQT